MKVQLRRWFAIGLTSGSLTIAMIAGSAAVGAAAAGPAATSTQATGGTHEQVDVIAIPATDRLFTIVPESASTLPLLTPDVSFSRDSRS